MIKSIAIGSFDAIHLAHQELIKRVDGVLIIEHHRATITPGWKRVKYINKPSFFYLLENIKELNPKEFIEKLKKDFPKLEKIVVGYDFRFAKDKKGDINTLKDLFDGYIEVVQEIKIDNISIHSRVIREFIKNSNIKMANKLLGRYYKIDGDIIKGLGIGSKELVPTINLTILNYTLPRGVFITHTYIKNKRYPSVTFIGNRLSINNTFSIETHILNNFPNSLKDYQNIEIEFLDFLRDNKKFASLKELKNQISKDIKKAKNYFELS